MNVQNFLPKYHEMNLSTYDAQILLALRGDAFYQFCNRERENGGIDPFQSLSVPRGQENVRVLFARTVEELMEARDSQDPQHFLEELIDAINFGTAIIFLNHGNSLLVTQLANDLNALFHVAESQEKKPLLPGDDEFDTRVIRIIAAFSPLLEKLRNRAWQNGAQHPYFMGTRQLREAICTLWTEVINCFGSLHGFKKMYLAKHDVLMFRLETKY